MNRIVRILTTGKPLTLIDQGIVDAIQNGNRVLVKAGSLSANFFDTRTPGKLESENRAIASGKRRQVEPVLWIYHRVCSRSAVSFDPCARDDAARIKANEEPPPISDQRGVRSGQ